MLFRSETQQSVMAFQRTAGLASDGIVGPLTWQALYDTYQGIENVIPPDVDDGVIEYVVRPGDTLWQLSQRFGTTVNAIMNLNGLSSDLLQIGQVLKIPNS